MTVSKNLSRLSRWPLLVGYCLFLYFGCTLPGEQLPEVVTQANDKVLHFLDFFLLALLSFRTFILSSLSFFHVKAGRKAALFSLLYGFLLEWAQRSVPGRDASFWDGMADALGVLVASGVFRISRLPRRGYPDPLK